MDLLYTDECYLLQGAIFNVYRELGNGFLEAVYQECLAREFDREGIPFVAQPELHLYYKGELLEKTYRADFICFDKIILELKTVQAIIQAHKAQVLNYLKMTKMELGLSSISDIILKLRLNESLILVNYFFIFNAKHAK